MSSQSFSSAAVLILAAFLCFSTLAEARCNQDGWFGTNCQYECHCAQSTPCNKDDGSCSSGCDPQWFGPACQYASIRLSEKNWLTDNDDSTCFPNHRVPFIHLTLTTPVPLTWIRVVHQAKGHLKVFRVMYGDPKSGYQQCPGNATVVVDDQTMDYNCTTSHAVQKIVVDYESFKSLCSLYISGGRNVALKQTTDQSSNFHETSWLSNYAVDGRLPGHLEKWKSIPETCTHSAFDQVMNWWTVNFNTPVDVTRILIHNREDCCRDRLKIFTLTVFQSRSELYKETGPDEEREMYSVVPSPKISSAVTQIKIQSRPNEILTLCEVEVFGELRCPTGWFGLACERECHCDNQTNCFVHSGRCIAGCAAGYSGATCSERCQAGKYGSNCSQNCSQHCKGGKTACNYVDGKCDECKEGYTGERCKSECQSGKYGRGCSQTCSEYCKYGNNACNHINGTCRGGCRDGYTGLQCEYKCSFGKHGAGCSKKCSEHCKSTRWIKVCNHTNGKCDDGCEDGYRGHTCQSKCEPGTYGSNCSLVCSQHCKGGNKSCDHVDGKCLDGCLTGYKDQNCKLQCDTGYFGEECKERCSEHCAGDQTSCNHVNGECDRGCDPGYNGVLCKQECDTGYFGEECKERCSEHCAGDQNSCSHVNGECDRGCDPGYNGVLCKQECDTGCFGEECKERCSEHCAGDQNSCNHVNGECDRGCDPGYNGILCKQDCPPRKYGRDCNMTCSVHCAGDDHACNIVTGACDQGCEPGYHGLLCTEDSSHENVWGISATVVAVLAIFVIIALVVRMLHKRSSGKFDRWPLLRM